MDPPVESGSEEVTGYPVQRGIHSSTRRYTNETTEHSDTDPRA